MLLHPEAPVRDRRFRHDLFPASDALWNLVADIVERLLRHENKHHVRQRKRKPSDLDGFRNAVAVIVANLVHSTVFPAASAAIILPLANARKARIAPVLPGFGRGLRTVLQGLQTIGVAIVTLPTELHQATTIAPSKSFRGEVLSHAFTMHDFRWSPVIDCIRLNRKDRQGKREAFAIPTTAEAALYREEMAAINGYLASADIAYVGNDPVDTSDRLMARYFNHPPHVSRPSLDLGGRMFGGFWQGLKRGARRHIRIGGEPIVELDYGQMFPRLAYAHVQASPAPDVDLYALPQLADICPEHRGTVKKAFNALMFKAGTMRKWPPEIAEGLPSGCSVGAFRKALVARHPALTDLLNTGIGYRLMNRESCIMCRVLMGCIALGITVLPIHDAVLCPASAAFMVQQIMADAARYVVGHTVPVSVKPPTGSDFRPSLMGGAPAGNPPHTPTSISLCEHHKLDHREPIATKPLKANLTPMRIIDTITTPDLSRITVHTDGACSGNPGPGGWAAIIVARHDGIEAPRQDISGGQREPTTNNRMELMAAIKALGWIKDRSSFSAAVPIHVRSDSQYVVNGMNVWLAKWLSNGWRGSDKRPVKNRDLWTELHGLAADLDVTWQWVRGHSGDPLNEAVDALAVAAIPKDEARRAA